MTSSDPGDPCSLAFRAHGDRHRQAGSRPPCCPEGLHPPEVSFRAVERSVALSERRVRQKPWFNRRVNGQRSVQRRSDRRLVQWLLVPSPCEPVGGRERNRLPTVRSLPAGASPHRAECHVLLAHSEASERALAERAARAGYAQIKRTKGEPATTSAMMAALGIPRSRLRHSACKQCQRSTTAAPSSCGAPPLPIRASSSPKRAATASRKCSWSQ